MVQGHSWEANWFAASQEIPRISRNPKVHYRTHKRPPPVHILGQPNPLHIPTLKILEIYPNIIHASTPRSPQWSLSLRFPHQDPIHSLSLPIRATCPAHLILLDFITRTILGEQYKSFSSSLCNLLHSPVTSSLLGTSRPYQQHIWNRHMTERQPVVPVGSIYNKPQWMVDFCFYFLYSRVLVTHAYVRIKCIKMSPNSLRFSVILQK